MKGSTKIEGRGERDADARRQGKWEFIFDTGERYAAGEFANGSRVGEWTYRFPNGQIAAHGAHISDGATELTGPWVYFHPNGAEAMRIEYDDIGFETGECREWYSNGQLACVTHYEMSDEDGPITLWHPNGARMAEGTVGCDSHIGEWRYWHDNGQLAFAEVKDEAEPREGYFDRDGALVSRDEFWATNLDALRREDCWSSSSTWPEGRFAGVDIWAESGDLLEQLGVIPPFGSDLLDALLTKERVVANAKR